jgi:hypothetical protein
MHRALSTNQPSPRCDTDKVSPQENPLGEIFRQYGEAYIEQYKPYIQSIKLIRAMRICKTPALGGKAYVCNGCGHKHYVFFGCGQSSCSICQSVKREQWMDKMKKELFAVPYVHLITTMPHQLNSLARQYPSKMYSLLFRVTNLTVNHFALKDKYLGAKPGMISVLHTFGSDMKYHVHIHSLLTFGGIDAQGKWRYPKQKTRYCKYKDFRKEFKRIYLIELQKLVDSQEVKLNPIDELGLEELKSKSWSFYVTKPAKETQHIELYLARYINRIAVTNSRLTYLKKTQEVRLVYNDYKNQKEGEPAPKENRTMNPLSFIHQYLMHLPPPYFHKTRRYGLHSSASKRKYAKVIEDKLKRNGDTIRTVMEIITQLLKLPKLSCEKCGQSEFEIIPITCNRNYKYRFMERPRNKSPNG